MTETTDESSSVTSTATPEEEQEAFEELGRFFKIIDSWQVADEQGAGLSVQPGSSLAADDRVSNPYQVSHLALHGITGALDHLHALRMLVQAASSLHTSAPFTLNRAAIEGGAVAVWLLAPKSRDERIRRRLVLATRNERDVDDVLTTMGEASSLDDHLEAIRKTAARCPALDPNGIVGRPPSLERIVQEAGDTLEIGSQAAVTCWKGCSGITHNRHWASMTLLDREELNRVANVLDVRLTASFRNVLTVTAISVLFSAGARRLFATRGMSHL